MFETAAGLVNYNYKLLWSHSVDTGQVYLYWTKNSPFLLIYRVSKNAIN